MKKTAYLKAITIIIATFLLLASCGGAEARYVSDSFFAMDTLIEVKLAKGTADSANIFAECRRITADLDAMLSAENGASEIARFNMSGEGCNVSREVGEVFLAARSVWLASGGAFDPTTYPATLLWRAGSAAGTLPSDDEISGAAAKKGMELIDYDEASGFLAKSQPWVMLDLGGVGKGYAEEKVIEYLGATDAAYGVLSFGGNISVFGSHPRGDFRIALRDPSGNGYAGDISVTSGYVSVSGGYERYYEIDGRKYCHIIDPASGIPVDGAIESAAVISANGAAADALSTALFVSGSVDAMLELYSSQKGTALEFEAILIYENEIYITPGLEGFFTLSCGRTLKTAGGEANKPENK